MPNSYFLGIWRTKEKAYSALIAQTLVLSKSFREFLEEQLRIEKGKLSLNSIETERVLSNEAGRIDVYIECENGLVIGIENKKWAGLQDNQLHRYAKALQKQSNNYRLIFLAPTKYFLPEEWKPENLFIITYKQVIDWIRIKQSNFEKNDFEKTYFDQLLAYLEDLEMKPLQDKEIESLLHYFSCEKKLRAILEELKEKDEYIEFSGGRFMLFSRFKKEYDNIPFYVGFRFGKKNWYYKDNLLNNSPECLVYIKDIWDDSEQEQKNNIVRDTYEKLKKETSLEKDGSRLDYYPRKGKEECRLAIRRSLSNFQDKDLSEIITWFKNTILLLEDYLPLVIS